MFLDGGERNKRREMETCTEWKERMKGRMEKRGRTHPKKGGGSAYNNGTVGVPVSERTHTHAVKHTHTHLPKQDELSVRQSSIRRQ